MILVQGCALEIPIGEGTEPSSPRLGSRKHERTTTRNRRAAPATKASDEDRASPLALFVVSSFRAFVIKGPAWRPGSYGGRSPPILTPRRQENKPVSRWSALRGPLSFRPHLVNAYLKSLRPRVFLPSRAAHPRDEGVVALIECRRTRARSVRRRPGGRDATRGPARSARTDPAGVPAGPAPRDGG